MTMFILTWNPDKSLNDDWWESEIDQFSKGNGTTIDCWSTGSRASEIEVGDTGILLRQKRERGILAVGHFTGKWHRRPDWNESAGSIDYAGFEVSQAVSVADRLRTEILLEEVPEVSWNNLMSSGTRADQQGADRVMELWDSYWSQLHGS